jgi:hypothetical protein
MFVHTPASVHPPHTYTAVEEVELRPAIALPNRAGCGSGGPARVEPVVGLTMVNEPSVNGHVNHLVFDLSICESKKFVVVVVALVHCRRQFVVPRFRIAAAENGIFLNGGCK